MKRDLDHYQSIDSPKESTEDAAFAETLNTKDTIRACISFYRKPLPGAVHITEVRMFLSLGYRVNGYPHVCHGGIVATLMDEVMGLLLALNKNMVLAPLQRETVTASLNVTYLKPVATPQTVLVTARLQDVKGRKHYLEATITNGSNIVLAKGEALFIRRRDPGEKL